jgi:hypothetical protein
VQWGPEVVATKVQDEKQTMWIVRRNRKQLTENSHAMVTKLRSWHACMHACSKVQEVRLSRHGWGACGGEHKCEDAQTG